MLAFTSNFSCQMGHSGRLAFSCLLASLAVACGGAPHAPASGEAATRSATRAETQRQLPQLDKAQVVLGLRGHESALHACFRTAGEPQPAFIELAWEVDADGVVGNVREVRSSGVNDTLAPCLAGHVREARFGNPGRPREARWTFVGGLVRFEDDGTRRRNRLNRQRGNRRADEAEEGIVIERSSPGKLEQDTVEEIVHSGYQLFAHCYRDGLSRQPSLGGAVRLRFVVGAEGRVARVIDGGSDLPDEQVVACIAEGFFALEFPKPVGGNLHLRYRMHFDSG